VSAPAIDPAPAVEQTRRTGLAKWIRRLSIPIIVGWIALVAVLNTTVPQLEVVGQMRSVSMSPKDAPSVMAMMRVGHVFEEFKSDSSVMIVLEGEQPLGHDAHRSRPIRNYFYWEPHCYNIPVCWSMRSLFDSLDGIDTMTDDIQALVPDLERLDSLMPQLLALMPQTVETMKTMRTMMLTMHATQAGMQDQQAAMSENQSAMGDAYNDAMNDDTFYLPPEIFENEEFKRGMESFISPNGHAVRFIINHEGDALTADGIERIDAIKHAAKEAIKGTPLEGSKIYVGGTASVYKDMQEGNSWDLLIAGIAALALIFIIMLLITRSVVAAAVIVGTVVLSLGASFGLSVLVWQHLLGVELHFMVMAMAVIILLAVGADYNLMLVARLKEEIPAGITGIIRAMGGTGSVVTATGLVFAFTMMSMAVAELVVAAQVGTTIGLGLLFDTLVVRAFMTPSIAALLGRWFWWPQVVRDRPVPTGWPTKHLKPLC
jgi:putative drug exporter of the RND superfamily